VNKDGKPDRTEQPATGFESAAPEPVSCDGETLPAAAPAQREATAPPPEAPTPPETPAAGASPPTTAPATPATPTTPAAPAAPVKPIAPAAAGTLTIPPAKTGGSAGAKP
jgi:hypothetical protein